ncbi:hypothetical protein, partial [Serratia marcescens]|uniref:hypothetical protein n=1 Tax=Serratia marcescens TaxID=615 RepID=UPI001954C254
AKLRAQAAILAGEVASATETIARREEEVIYRLSRAADSRDADTGRHIVRMARYCVLIAEALGLDADYCRSLR